MRRKRYLKAGFLIPIFGVFVLVSGAFGTGDVDDNEGVDLRDTITVLQICAGMKPDVNAEYEGKIGLKDAIFALQVVSGIIFLPKEPGDLGMPDDYEQTMKSFIDSFPDTGSYESSVAQLPETFDWRDKGVVTRAKDQRHITPADDQGWCGSCWAFAAVGALESKILMAGGPEYDLSEQQQISCNNYNYGCCGGSLNAAVFWRDRGALRESCTGYGDYGTTMGSCGCRNEPPYTHCSNVSCGNMGTCGELSYRTDEYYSVNTGDGNEVKLSLTEDGPANFRFDTYTDFFDFWNTGSHRQVYRQSDGFQKGGHAVLLIGWDDGKGAWLCKNSWGERNGPNNDGTFYIAYSGHNNNLYFGMSNFTITDTAPTTTTTTSSTTTTSTTTTTVEPSTTTTTISSTTTTTSSTTTTVSTTTTTIPQEDCLILQSETVTGTKYETADHCIRAGTGYVVESGGDVTMEAGTVYLEPGFEAKAGSKFRATAK